MNDVRSLNHTVWECKYQYCMDSEISEEGALRAASEGVSAGASGIGNAEGE